MSCFMSKAVLATTSSRAQTELIVAVLDGAGFAARDISVLAAKPPALSATNERDARLAENPVIGGTVLGSAGAVVGGTLGVLGAFGIVSIPGLGAFLALGPLLGMLSGAAIGASVGMTAGTLTGVLLALGIPELQAHAYQARVASGRVVVSVHTESRRRQMLAAAVFRHFGALDLWYLNDDLQRARGICPYG